MKWGDTMEKTFKFWALIRAAGALLLLSVAAVAQLPPTLEMRSFSTGLQPMGLDIVYPTPNSRGSSYGEAFAVVANSGENSVSILSAFSTLNPITKVMEIPSPYGVAACLSENDLPSQHVLVTSPSDNSVRVLRISD